MHPPPPTWEKSSTQKCPNKERRFRPDTSAKKNVHVPLRYDKIKTKKLGKKEEKRKRKGIKFKKIKKEDSHLSEIEIIQISFTLIYHYCCFGNKQLLLYLF